MYWCKDGGLTMEQREAKVMTPMTSKKMLIIPAVETE